MNAMSELKTLDERIDFLETKLTFLDNTIETLNTTITEQWLKIDGLSRQLASLNARLQEAEARPPGPANEPPPHY
jgi:SlyX protein